MNAKMLLLLVWVPWAPLFAQDDLPSTPNEAAMRQVLAPMMPGDLVVDEIRFEGMRAILSGRSPEHSLVSDLMRNIDASPMLAMPELQQIMRVDGMSEFVVTTVVTCPSVKDAAVNPCRTGTPSASPTTTVHKCVVNGVVTFQSSPCPDE